MIDFGWFLLGDYIYFWGIDPEKRPKTIGSMGLVYINLHESLICMVFMQVNIPYMDPMSFSYLFITNKQNDPKTSRFPGVFFFESETVQTLGAARGARRFEKPANRLNATDHVGWNRFLGTKP